jgi:hypothetical protein
LITRIRWLVANKKDFVFPGTDNNLLIQRLGDAYGIFKKSKAHGTSIVMKTKLKLFTTCTVCAGLQELPYAPVAVSGPS